MRFSRRTNNENDYDPDFARQNPPMNRNPLPEESVIDTVKKLVDKLPGPGYVIYADSLFGCMGNVRNVGQTTTWCCVSLST